jgi:hypothetical protein
MEEVSLSYEERMKEKQRIDTVIDKKICELKKIK